MCLQAFVCISTNIDSISDVMYHLSLAWACLSNTLLLKAHEVISEIRQTYLANVDIVSKDGSHIRDKLKRAAVG